MKNGLKILIAILLLMSFTVKVKADDKKVLTSKIDGYTAVCGYQQVKKSWSGTSITRTNQTFYLYIANDYYSGNEKYAMSGPNGIEKDITLSSKKVVKNLTSYKNSGCPTGVYAWSPLTCFYYDKDECSASDYTASDGSTRSGSTIESTKKTHNVKNELINIAKAKVNEFDVSKMSADNPICKGEIPTIEDIKADLNAKLNERLKMYGTDDINNSAFINVAGEIYGPLDSIPTKLDKAIEKCKELIKEDDTLTEPEKQEALDNLGDEASAAADELAKELSEYLKEQMKYDYQDDFTGGDGCDGLLGDTGDPNDPAYYVRLMLLVMRYAAVVLAVILSMIDFFKAIIAQDKEAVMKAAKTSGYRLAFAVIIFFLPIVIDFIMGLLGDEFKLCISYILF